MISDDHPSTSVPDEHENCIGIAEARRITGLGKTNLRVRFDRGELAVHRVVMGEKSIRHFDRAGCIAVGATERGEASGRPDIPPSPSSAATEARPANTLPHTAARPQPSDVSVSREKATVDALLERLLEDSAARTDTARAAVKSAEAHHRTLTLLVHLVRRRENDERPPDELKIDEWLDALGRDGPSP